MPQRAPLRTTHSANLREAVQLNKAVFVGPPLQGGGPVRTMNLLAWGVDLVEEQLLASAGECYFSC